VNLAISYQYSFAENFNDSLAIVAKEGRYGVIDYLDNQVIPTSYKALDWAGDFLIAQDSMFGLVSQANDTIVPFLYQEAEVVDERVISFKRFDGSMMYFDCQSKAILRNEE
jgi:hypothetical protein